MKTNGKVTVMIAALIAVAMSGIALAKHEEGHDKGQGPKSSVNITNTCILEVDNMTTSGIPNHVLKVTTVIEDASDNNSMGFNVDSKTVKGEQSVKSSEPPKKQQWKDVGYAEQDPDNPNQVNINLCQTPRLENGATALNASVWVEVDGRFFLSRCDDDPDTFCGYDEDGAKIICEEKDESIVLPVDDNGDPISCDLR